MAVSLPPSQVVPGSVDIPLAPWPTTTKDESVNTPEVASKIVNSFNELLSKQDHKGIGDLFLEHSYWRDHLACSWDFRTIKGRNNIVSFLDNTHHLKSIEIITKYASEDVTPQATTFRGDGSVHGIQIFIRAQTENGSGPGNIRLIRDGSEYKIWTLYTSMTELKDFAEPRGPLRPLGVTHGQKERKNWLERKEESNFADPDVLIIGAGQAGLAVSARLKMLQVPTLVIDKNDKVGDGWRNRYHHLVLHDPVYYDHMPYIKFPDFWPIFTPKDKLASFFESYAEMLELNVWNNTSLESSNWDDEKKQWEIVLKRTKKDGSIENRVIHPKFVVQATGHSGQPNFINIPGMESFEGDVLCHSSEFKGAKKDGKGKKAVVIGACNSGLDISTDFYESGYDVTIVQRSSTTVMSSKAVLDLLTGPVYSEDGPPVEIGDLHIWSKPSELYKSINGDIHQVQQVQDGEMLDSLDRAGFKTHRFPLWMKYLERGSGYYIDVGASQLIIDGKIKVKHGVGVSEILPRGVRFEDGTELEADEIVCATGYKSMRTTTEVIFGKEVASRVNDVVWGYNSEGEINTFWKTISGHPGLFLCGGNLAITRYFSQFLAIQLKARLEGLCKQD